MLSTSDSKEILEAALKSLLVTIEDETTPEPLYLLYYEQSARTPAAAPPVGVPTGMPTVVDLPASSLGLAFDDGTLGAVRTAWEVTMGAAAAEIDFMAFEDREGADEDDDMYE